MNLQANLGLFFSTPSHGFTGGALVGDFKEQVIREVLIGSLDSLNIAKEILACNSVPLPASFIELLSMHSSDLPRDEAFAKKVIELQDRVISDLRHK